MDHKTAPSCPHCGYTLLAEGGRHLASGTTECPVATEEVAMTYLCWRCSAKDDTHTGTCRACLKAMRPPPPDRAVDGYAYLMCDEAVPVDDDPDQT